MKGKILGLMVGFLLIGLNLFAADGDLIVNGKVGIGTTEPGAKLEVNGASSLFNNTSGGNNYHYLTIKGGTGAAGGILAIYDGVTTSGNYLEQWVNGGYIKFDGMPGSGSNPGYQFRTGGSNLVTIQNTGNVGIGTASPAYKLDVNGTARIQASSIGDFRFSSIDAYAVRLKNSGGNLHLGGGSIIFEYGGTEAARMKLFDSGGFAIGSSYTATDPGANNVIIQGNFGIGTTNPGSYRLYVSGTAYSTGEWQSSDLRFKENIAPIESPLEKILNIRGVTFNWKAEEFKDKGFPGGRHYGVIAQEIEKVLPEVVKEGPEGEKGVSYTEIIPLLIEAMKDQHKEIQRLKAEVAELKVKN